MEWKYPQQGITGRREFQSRKRTGSTNRNQIDERDNWFKNYRSLLLLSCPYPRWISLYQNRFLPFVNFLRQTLYPNKLSNIEFINRPEVLIAGCGTGRQAISSAQAFKNSSVLAVDLSLTSLSYAKRKTDELLLENIEFLQADILELGSLNKSFDVIECAGAPVLITGNFQNIA